VVSAAAVALAEAEEEEETVWVVHSAMTRIIHPITVLLSSFPYSLPPPHLRYGIIITNYRLKNQPQPPPVPNPLSKEERHIVARYRLYRDKIHNGPLYTVVGKKRGMEDPFNDVSKYSAKYKRQKRRVPKLDSRPYVKELFPRELWETLGIDGDGDAEDGGGKGKVKGKGKKLIFSALDVIGGLDEEDEEDGEGEDGEDGGKGKKKGVLQRLLGEDVGDDDGDDDDEVAEEEEEVEDDFGDDEEGDYNAEMYFNDGDDDGGDDWGDEGGGEDYY